MSKGKWRLAVSDGFSAAHQLRHYGGKCENMHGHNFEVKVEVEGDTLLPDVEIVMDFKDLKNLLKAVLDELDHAHLNDTPFFRERNPSSENLARHIYQRIKAGLPGSVRPVSVTVSEKPTQSATYFED